MKTILKYMVLTLIFISCSKSNDKETSATACGNVTDIDGNVYSSVKLDNNCWLTQNLNVSRYRNGDVIPEVRDPTQWTNLTTGAWCYAENNPENGAIYGKLYNWYAVLDPRGLAPEGWHVPSDIEWISLRNSLGGFYLAGGKMKEVGYNHWAVPNEGATNSSGFNALPGGYRSFLGDVFLVDNGSFWSSSEDDSGAAGCFMQVEHDTPYFYKYSAGAPVGMSVRCLKDR